MTINQDDPNERTEAPGLWTALLAVQKEVTTFGKDSRNQHGKYNYLSADAAISKARPLLTKHGLAFRVTSSRYIGEPIETVDGKNRPQLMCTVECTFHLVHAPTGQCTTWEASLAVESKAGTPLDKATLAGRTELINYALRDLLLFDRGEGVSGREDKTEEVRTARRAIAERNQQISAIRNKLGMSAEEALQVCSDVTGKSPSASQWTVADADKLLAHFRELELQHDVRGE